MAPSPDRAREAVFGKAARALDLDTQKLASDWAAAFRRRVSERGEPFPAGHLEERRRGAGSKAWRSFSRTRGATVASWE